MQKAKGSIIYDVDGNEYIDYLLGFGPVVLGHAHPCVNEAVREQLERGEIFGANSELEIKVAERIINGIQSVERVIFTNTGSEATLLALRIARAFTGKEKIVKFEMAYHGWHDWCMVDTFAPPRRIYGGSKISPLKALMSPGVPSSVLDDVIICPWNDFDAIEKIVDRHSHEVAALICETPGPSGLMLPHKGYLEFLRKITYENDIILIFDEVKSGFRLAFGGAMEYYKVTPDLAVFAKAMGNGFPIACVAGKKNVMQPVAEYQIMYSGTYNAHPISMAAALATLNELEKNSHHVIQHICKLGEYFKNGMKDIIEETKVEAIAEGVGSIIWLLFSDLENIKDARDLYYSTTKYKDRFDIFRNEMLKRKVFLPAFVHPWFICGAHTKEQIDKTIEAVEESLKKAKLSG
jgi:glutamate-1-semialdehyde 2,1-aminomutase